MEDREVLTVQFASWWFENEIPEQVKNSSELLKDLKDKVFEFSFINSKESAQFLNSSFNKQPELGL